MIMKKNYSILFLAAGLMTAALSLNSCDNRMGSDLSDGFSFSATAVSYNGSAGTKAAPINTVDAFQSTYTSFTVSAYKGAVAKFTGGTSTYSSGEWNLTASDVKWWPDETLDFYALAFPETTPSMITLANTMVVIPSTKTAVFDYTFSLDSATGENTPDIMFGYYSDTGTASGGKRIAPLTFYHPFAAVKFKAGADLVGATVNSITITNVANGGTCTIAASNLATAGNSAISWTHDSGHIDYSNTYAAAITAADQQIGTDDQTFILIPQTLGATAKLEVNLTTANNTEYTLEASLEDVALSVGTILNITINFDNIVLGQNLMITPYDDTSYHIHDPQFVPTYAYLSKGTTFNTLIKSVIGSDPYVIKFERFGAVDESGVQVQDQEVAHEGAYPIFAKYLAVENAVDTLLITTHANTIYLNSDCSHMFEDLAGAVDILFGDFFESEGLNNTSYMFKGCSNLVRINLSGVLNTELVTDISYMFAGCTSAIQIFLGQTFYVTNVVNMSHLFYDCHSASTIELGSHFSSLVVTEDMSYMYYNCSSMNQLTWHYCPAVTSMDYMFYGCDCTGYISCSSVKNPPTQATGEKMFYHAIHSGGSFTMIYHAVYNWVRDSANNTGFDSLQGVSVGFYD